ncbi:MAG TPA: hypothetical protein VFC44_04225 [Candidatus Saccharimonadales bacterium]|nr:hypothetical protein [Candidatus Saccharimonadales bacterium]
MGELAGQGKKPTLVALHAALNNRGSMSTLVRLKAEIDAAAQPVTDSADGLKIFRDVWALAVDEGRQQQEAVLAEARDSIRALATENERLEGAALAAETHAAELDQARLRAETDLAKFKSAAEIELNKSRTAQAEAASQAADALKKLAEDRAVHAAKTAALQDNLSAAVRKAHEIELNLVRTEALLTANAVALPTGSSRPAKQGKPSS